MTASLQTAPRIFISHSHKDNDFGLNLVQDLRQALGDDSAVWYDAKGGLHGGDNWWSRIKEELKARSVFIVILSPDSMASTWVRDEIDLAWYQKNTAAGKKIIPLLYRECPIPDELALRHIVSFLPPRAYEDAFNDLLIALELPVGMETKGALGKPDDAAEAFVLQMTPQIQAAFDRKNWLEVIQKANLLIRQVPVAIPHNIYHMQGIAYLQTGDFEQANDALNTALALVSDSGTRLELLGEHVRVLTVLGRWQEVLRHASEALGLVPKDPGWLAIQADALSKLAESGQEPSQSMFLATTQPATSPLRVTSYTYREHTGWVYDITWSPDSKYIASASADHTVHVWEWEGTSGKRIFTYKGHTKRVNTIAWLPVPNEDEEIDTSSMQEWPEGMWIVSGSNDKTIHIWNAVDGETFVTYRGHTDWINSIAWSPDRTRIASASNDKTVQIWDAATGTPLITYRNHTHWVNSVAWSHDGALIASASSDKTVQIWDATNGRHILTYNGHTKGVNNVLWSPRSISIASASNDKTVQVWDATTGDHGLTYKDHRHPVLGLTRSPHGRRIASAGGESIHVWYAATGDNIIVNSQHKDWVRAIAWSPNGRYLASASDDKTVQVRSISPNDQR